MICPNCKARYKKPDFTKPFNYKEPLLIPSKGADPAELMVHSTDMTEYRGKAADAFEAYFVVCPCGHALAAVVYNKKGADAKDFVPTYLVEES